MQFQSIQNAIDLLPPPPPPPDQALTENLAGTVEPKLEVGWGSFHQGFWSGVAAQFGPRAGKDALAASPFRDSWVEGRIPKRAVVAAAKYPPLGERGLSAALPQLQFRTFPAAETLPALNDATLVIVQFESKAALDAMEEIVAVDGVDLVLIGTNDLMVDLGIPGQYDHPKVRDAYERTIAACRKRGKHVGVGGLGSRPDLMAQFVKMGARYVSTGTDLAFLMAACTQRAKQVRDIQL